MTVITKRDAHLHALRRALGLLAQFYRGLVRFLLHKNNAGYTNYRAFTASYMRASPSGKASASQADTRGFESRCPLHSNLRHGNVSLPCLFSIKCRDSNPTGCERLQWLFCCTLVKQARHVVFLYESAGRRQGLCAESLRPGFASQEVFCRAHSGDDTIFLCRERLDALGAGGCFGLE